VAPALSRALGVGGAADAASAQPFGNGISASAAQSAAPVSGPPRLAADDPNAVSVSAPLLGTFYRGSQAGRCPPSLKWGSQVEQTPSSRHHRSYEVDEHGACRCPRPRWVEIHCRDGALVEYGEVLMHVIKTS